MSPKCKFKLLLNVMSQLADPDQTVLQSIPSSTHTLQQLQIHNRLYSAMMNFVDAHPLASCDAGGNGRMVLMIADNNLPKDVKPIFQVHVQGTHKPELDKFLVQPEKMDISPRSVLKFATPPQPNIRQINEAFSVKLTARNSVGIQSTNMWTFIYNEHKTKVEEKSGGGCGWQGGKSPVERRGAPWSAVERRGAPWSAVERRGTPWNAVERRGAATRGGLGGNGSGYGQNDCMFCAGILD
jgi:hypothetical protein